MATAGADLEYSFAFRAMNAEGRTSLGVRSASDAASLADALRRDGLVLLGSWRLPGGGAPTRLSLKDEAALNDQIHALLSRGVPLVDALEVAATVVSTPARGRIARLRELVASGSTFSGACEKVGGFDDVIVSVYRAAERTGDLAPSARRLAASARRRLSIRGKAVTVLIYPAVVLVIAAVLIAVLLTVIVPQLAETLRQAGAELPWFSEVVFGLGSALRANWVFALLGLALVAAGLVAGRRQLLAGLNRIGQRLPGAKGLLLASELTRFFSVMGAMTRSGVPLADALGVSAAVINNRTLRTQLETLRRSLVEGGVLRVLIERVDALPLATRRLLIAAERSGDLDSAFDALAADMADEVEVRSARMLALLEPASIVLLFLIIAPIIIAVAVPMLTSTTLG